MPVIHIRNTPPIRNTIRNITHVERVIRHVQVLQLLQITELPRNVPLEAIPLQIQRLQVAITRNVGRNLLLQVTVINHKNLESIRERAPLGRNLGPEGQVPEFEGLQGFELGESVTRFSGGVGLVWEEFVGAGGGRAFHVEDGDGAVLARDALPRAAVGAGAGVPGGEDAVGWVGECRAEVLEGFECG